MRKGKRENKNTIEKRPARYYDLEDWTLRFSLDVFSFLRKVLRTIENQVVIRQLARSASSIGANYIEANDNLGKKDFVHKTGISKKEAKESCYWLKLVYLEQGNDDIDKLRETLLKEATELMYILAAIQRKMLEKK